VKVRVRVRVRVKDRVMVRVRLWIVWYVDVQMAVRLIGAGTGSDSVR